MFFANTAWKLQSWLWKFLPSDRAVSFSLRIFGVLLALSAVGFCIGYFAKRRWLTRMSTVAATLLLLAWAVLYATRPAWLKIAMQPVVPSPATSEFRWVVRSAGLETADVELKVGEAVVDRLVLCRLDPRRYRFTVHWDPTASRTAEDWQRDLGATVVVMGSYFGQDFSPLTPLRVSGQSAGPKDYQSSHGAFVASAGSVEIVDLRNQDVSQVIDRYPEAIVSYPLLIDPTGENRAVESRSWLASRNFVAIDDRGRVVLGTTQRGFFTIRRLGEFLKSSPLGLRMALNLDGGPGVSQVVRAGDFTRNFHGTAEISNGSDVLRVFWHEHFGVIWTLPIVLAATPISE